MPEETVSIPDLPPATPDFNSYIGQVAEGSLAPATLEPRLRARDGYARSEDDRYVNDYQPYRETGSLEYALREDRQVTKEQAKVITDVAERITTFKQTEKRLTDTASFLEAVLAGGIPSGELEPRLRARDGYARSEDDRYVNDYQPYRETGSLEYALREDRQVTKEQAKVITDVAERITTFKQTEKRLTDTASFLEAVLAGGIPSGELEPRLRARDGYARSEDDRYVNDYQPYRETGSLEYALREDRQVTKEQAELIRIVAVSSSERRAKLNAARGIESARRVLAQNNSAETINNLAKENSDPALIGDLQALLNLRGRVNDPSVDSLIVEFFDNRGDKPLFEALEKRGIELADISDNGSIRSEEIYLRDYVQTARRVALRTRFWSDMQGTFNPNDGFRALEEYTTYDETDRQVVGELRLEGLKVRRDAFILETFRRLAAESPDYAAAAIYLSSVANIAGELRDSQTIQALKDVVSSAYQSEISLVFGNLVKELTLDEAQISEVSEKVKNVPIRPAIAGVDFFEKFQKANEQFLGITRRLKAFAFERKLTQLRGNFLNEPNVTGLVEQIFDLPGETAEDSALRKSLLDELALYVGVQRGIDPARYNQLKGVAIEGIRSSKANSEKSIDLAATPERRNIAAVRNVVGRFQRSIMPLFESIRGGVNGEALVEDYIAGGENSPRSRYVQSIAALREQRALTDTEQAYLESVELLSVFNPHLVALAKEQPELTSLYLENYFEQLDTMTKEKLVDGIYVPAIQIGLGPSGLAAAGELNRSNPDLAAQTLYIDGQQMPGGPFAVAKGLAWELNSANSQGKTTNTLPDLAEAEEATIAVRSYGSPLVAYPGERKEGSDTRQASINVTTDYLLNPDNVSTKRYPTNVDLARVLQLQAAMLVDNVLLSTEVTKVSPASDNLPGNKIVELTFTTASGEKVITTVRTDFITLSSGLGKPNYGIKLEGSSAAEILQGENLGKDNYPLLTDTIGAFEALSNPEGAALAPEGTIAIYGGGNSADVLIEYLGRQFESSNPALNGITKVYVLTSGQLSRRPRYAQINDLKSRNGQPNFLEIVNAKVADVRQGSDGLLEPVEDKGQPIIVGSNGGTKLLRANHVISASGFRPMLDEVFAPLLAKGESIDRSTGLERVTLPNNPGFSIADALINDPDVLIVGTASRADFKNPNKLAQLPEEAREALLRNGAENAVAVGFRTPDTRAAVRLKLGNKSFANRSELQLAARQQVIDIEDKLPESVQASVPLLPPDEMPVTRRDVQANSDTLTALFLGNLPKLQLTKGSESVRPDSKEANQAFEFTVVLDKDQNSFNITPSQDTPTALNAAVQKAIANSYFQAYALKALRSRRTNKGLEVALSFSSGRLRLRDAGAEADDSRRTYVQEQ